MKKTLLTIGMASVLAISSQAQGYILFTSSTQNMSTNNVAGTQQVIGQAVGSGRAAGAGNFYYALFVNAGGAGAALSAQSGNPANTGGNLSGYVFNSAGWTLVVDTNGVSPAAASTASPGRFAATNPLGDGSSQVAGITGGNQYSFDVVGWSANLGTTLAQAIAALSTPGAMGYFGQSASSGLITVGNGGSIPPSGIFGGGAPSMQAFTLGSFNNVPEPGTLALAALGGASLLMFRRKK